MSPARMEAFERRWANGYKVFLAGEEPHAGLFGPARGAAFNAVPDEERLSFTAACIVLKRSSTELAAVPRPTERRLILRPRNAGQMRQV